MPIGPNANTNQFPRVSEKAFYVAPQTAENTAATTGFQALHFMDYDPQRNQDSQQSFEYGGGDASGNASVDPGDPEFGDVTVTGNLQTRLCLNEMGTWLAYALGAPVTTDLGSGRFQHIYESGKPTLPLATILDIDSQNNRTVQGAAITSTAIALARGGGIQVVDLNLKPKDLTLAARAPLLPADFTDAPARLFVEKNNFSVEVDDTPVGKVLDAGFTYSADIQEDRYIEPGAVVQALYVGDPSLSVNLGLRHVSEAQRAAFGGPDTPMKIALIGPSTGNTSIKIEFPRVIGPITFPSKDDKLQKLNFSGQGAKTEGGSPAPMVRVTLINTVAAY